MFIKALQTFASVFFPFRCHVCNIQTEFGLVLCETCRKKLQQIIEAPKLTEDTRCSFPVYTLSSYNTFVADVIRIIKYRPSLKLLKILAEICLEKKHLRQILQKDDILIPVPMHSERYAKRGFNQAGFLAETFAEFCGCHYSEALLRSRATRPQADCDEEERQTNLENAFALSPGLVFSAFQGRRLFLVDDVATTGATLQQCAEHLQPLFPAGVFGLVVSHSYKRTNLPTDRPKQLITTDN